MIPRRQGAYARRPDRSPSNARHPLGRLEWTERTQVPSHIAMKSIYLDYNATTPLDPTAAEAMARCQQDLWGNPSSQHAWGRRAHRAIEDAREDIARILGAKTRGRQADHLVFT